MQREAVVGRDEVDAGVRPAAAPFVQVARTAKPRGKLRHHAAVPLPETANAIAILAVPFRPQRRKVADLVAAGPQVPRLGDQLDLRDDRILVNDVEKRAQLVHFVQLAGQRARQIEAKPVDVHVPDPVPQAVHDQLQDPRIAHVERIAAAGEVHVVPRILGREPVVRGVVDAAKRQRGPQVVALGRVVVDHVQNHLDAGRVQVADHGLELADHFAGRVDRGIPRRRREEAQRVVAPVVHQPTLDQVPVVERLLHGQQLDGRDAQVLQIANRRVGAQPGVGAA